MEHSWTHVMRTENRSENRSHDHNIDSAFAPSVSQDLKWVEEKQALYRRNQELVAKVNRICQSWRLSKYTHKFFRIKKNNLHLVYLVENRLNVTCNNGWFAGQADGRWRAATEKRHPGCQRPERAAGVQDPGVRGENVADASNSVSNFQTFTCDFCLLFRRGSGAHPPSISNSSISQKASVLYRFTVRQRESLWVHPSPVNISEGCTASMFSKSRLALC